MAKKKEVKAPIVYGEFVVVKQVLTENKEIKLIGVDGKKDQLVDMTVVSVGPQVDPKFGIKKGDNPIFAGQPQPIGTKIIEREPKGNGSMYLIFHVNSFIGKESE